MSDLITKRSNTERILDHIRQLSGTIGPRGSCTPNERRASIYVLSVLKKLGLDRVGLEEFRGHPSTYQPYILAFLAALAGAAAAWLFPDWRGFILVVMGAIPGAGGMLTETNLDSSNDAIRFTESKKGGYLFIWIGRATSKTKKSRK